MDGAGAGGDGAFPEAADRAAAGGVGRRPAADAEGAGATLAVSMGTVFGRAAAVDEGAGGAGIVDVTAAGSVEAPARSPSVPAVRGHSIQTMAAATKIPSAPRPAIAARARSGVAMLAGTGRARGTVVVLGARLITSVASGTGGAGRRTIGSGAVWLTWTSASGSRASRPLAGRWADAAKAAAT